MLDCISVENMRRSDAETINQFVPGLALNPVTRKPQNSKAYNRKRTQEWKKELPNLRPFLLVASNTEHLVLACLICVLLKQ